jgi:hypothetical protein
MLANIFVFNLLVISAQVSGNINRFYSELLKERINRFIEPRNEPLLSYHLVLTDEAFPMQLRHQRLVTASN